MAQLCPQARFRDSFPCLGKRHVPTLYTIGYKGKPLRAFIGQLRSAAVDAVIDVRLRISSHLLGYTKRDDFAFLLNEGFDIAYEHHPELAPTTEILLAYRETQDWLAYETRFRPLLADRDVSEVGRDILNRYRAPCLLCAEPTVEHCHRRLVAEHWAQHIPDLSIVHLQNL
jgi:uncharacterized protein (DUF488 family)